MTKSSPSEAETPDCTSERIIIGKVGKPHGIKGDVRVYPLTDFPERFDSLREVTVGQANLVITDSVWHGNILLMRFQGCDSREKAAKFTGELLSLPREDAMPLAEDEYYVFDIVGLRVYDEAENFLGEVREVLSTGANDVYVIGSDGAKDLLIPALKTTVKKIDVPAGKMIVSPLPEYGGKGRAL